MRFPPVLYPQTLKEYLMSGFNTVGSLGQSQAPSSRPPNHPDNTALVQITSQLKDLEEFLARDTSRLQQLAIQLYGNRPEKEAGTGVLQQGGNVMSQISSLRHQCEELRSAIDAFYNG